MIETPVWESNRRPRRRIMPAGAFACLKVMSSLAGVGEGVREGVPTVVAILGLARRPRRARSRAGLPRPDLNVGRCGGGARPVSPGRPVYKRLDLAPGRQRRDGPVCGRGERASGIRELNRRAKSLLVMGDVWS